jgi:hypothetical protein
MPQKKMPSSRAKRKVKKERLKLSFERWGASPPRAKDKDLTAAPSSFMMAARSRERRSYTMRMPTKHEAFEFLGCLMVIVFIIALQFV